MMFSLCSGSELSALRTGAGDKLTMSSWILMNMKTRRTTLSKRSSLSPLSPRSSHSCQNNRPQKNLQWVDGGASYTRCGGGRVSSRVACRRKKELERTTRGLLCYNRARAGRRIQVEKLLALRVAKHSFWRKLKPPGSSCVTASPAGRQPGPAAGAKTKIGIVAR